MPCRKLFYFMVFMLFSIIALGQKNKHTGKVNIGIDGGIQITNLNNFKDFYTPRSRIGFTAGLFGDYNFSDKLKLRLGLKFDQRNFELYGYKPLADSTGLIGTSYHLYDLIYRVKYMTIPLNIIYKTGSEKVKLIVKGGAYFSFLLNTYHKGTESYFINGEEDFDLSGKILHYGLNDFTYSGSTQGIEFVIADSVSQSEMPAFESIKFNSVDYGLNIAIGLEYWPIPSIGFTFLPGFTYSISNAFENRDFDYKWQQIVNVNIGFIYTVSKRKQSYNK